MAASTLASQHGDTASRACFRSTAGNIDIAAMVSRSVQALRLTTNQEEAAAISSISDIGAAASSSNNTHLAALATRCTAQTRRQKHITTRASVAIANNKLDR
ncbi:MAG: hypothetical protein GY941_21260, partial [Planctomycetes bacterium]|nr:hypothetical protein [Planctomycetota bacterium]